MTKAEWQDEQVFQAQPVAGTGNDQFLGDTSTLPDCNESFNDSLARLPDLTDQISASATSEEMYELR